MKVRCINSGNFKNITTNNEYEVFYDNGNTWTITSNDLQNRVYSKKYFEVILEPVIEDINEVGVVEEKPKFLIEWDDENIEISVNGYSTILYFYSVASNCGVHSYHGINMLFELCNSDKKLFKEIIEAVIRLIESEKNCCMFILSTNDEYDDIWDVLNEVMDFGSKVVENPNSDMDVRLWIKYIETVNNNW